MFCLMYFIIKGCVSVDSFLHLRIFDGKVVEGLRTEPPFHSKKFGKIAVLLCPRPCI